MRMNAQCLFICSVLIVVVWLKTSCTMRQVEKTTVSIPYPQPVPDSVALDFLPGIVSTDKRDFGAAFSPDGKSFYFSRSEKSKSHIYVSHHDGKNWTLPALVSFNSAAYAEADPAFGLDGKLYFISDRPSQPSDTILDYDIWFVSPRAEGVWSEPENMEAVNSDSAEFYISFSQNGNLYFASAREGGFGAEDIYVSQFTNNHYSTPENLGAAVNSEKSEYDPFISVQEDFIIFTSSNREDTFGGGDL